MTSNNNWICYILLSLDSNKTYVGATDCLYRRLSDHNGLNGKSKGGSKLMIPLSRSKEVEKNQFIRFNTHLMEKNKLSDQVVKKSNFDMDFNLSIDSQSEIQLIIDEELGDIIKGYGEGDLSLKLNKEGDFEVFCKIGFLMWNWGMGKV